MDALDSPAGPQNTPRRATAAGGGRCVAGGEKWRALRRSAEEPFIPCADRGFALARLRLRL